MSLLSGLNNNQVALNQKKFGPNEITKKKKVSLIIKILKKFANPLILMLLFSSILSFFLGQRTDFYIILIILVISVALDVYQEHQAQDAADKLSQKLVLKVLVIRNNQKIEINASQLTIDDLVIVNVGDIIPADCQIIESEKFSVDQSVLTGESFPLEKKQGILFLLEPMLFLVLPQLKL